MPSSGPAARVCVGAIVGAQGIRGAVRIKSFTDDPVDVAAYGPVEDESGSRRFTLTVDGLAKGLVVARLKGVVDRNGAEALKGVTLYVPRERLPEADGEDEFLYSDLVGLAAEGLDGVRLGTVKGVFDFGAGEVLEIALAAGGSLMVAFTRAVVPVVDVAGGRLVVDPPAFAPDDKDDAALRAEAASGERG